MQLAIGVLSPFTVEIVGLSVQLAKSPQPVYCTEEIIVGRSVQLARSPEPVYCTVYSREHSWLLSTAGYRILKPVYCTVETATVSR